jgi:hypothetical protein
LEDCGNLKFPDFNFTDFCEKTYNFADFVLKKQVLAMFYAICVQKNFFHPNFRDYSPEKFFSGKMSEFSNVVILCSRRGNFFPM